MIPLGVENETRVDAHRNQSDRATEEQDNGESQRGVLWYRVENPEKAVLTVEDYRRAVQQLALTTLRNVIGQHDLDEVLKERDKIDALLRGASLQHYEQPWGCVGGTAGDEKDKDERD